MLTIIISRITDNYTKIGGDVGSDASVPCIKEFVTLELKPLSQTRNTTSVQYHILVSRNTWIYIYIYIYITVLSKRYGSRLTVCNSVNSTEHIVYKKNKCL